MAICKACFRPFTPGRKDQRYCSEDCRLDYYSQVRERGRHVTKVCGRCGKEFDTACPHKQSYCSAECRIAHQKDRDRRSERAVARRGANFVERLEDVEAAILAIVDSTTAGGPLLRELVDRIASRKKEERNDQVVPALDPESGNLG